MNKWGEQRYILPNKYTNSEVGFDQYPAEKCASSAMLSPIRAVHNFSAHIYIYMLALEKKSLAYYRYMYVPMKLNH